MNETDDKSRKPDEAIACDKDEPAILIYRPRNQEAGLINPEKADVTERITLMSDIQETGDNDLRFTSRQQIGNYNEYLVTYYQINRTTLEGVEGIEGIPSSRSWLKCQALSGPKLERAVSDYERLKEQLQAKNRADEEKAAADKNNELGNRKF